MDGIRDHRERRVFRWPQAADELVRNYLGSKDGQKENKNAVVGLATKLAVLTGNPRDACLRYLHRRGMPETRRWRPWTRPEQQRLIDLVEKCPIEEVARLMRRSPSSIRSMLHRLGESPQRGRNWITPRSLADALHVHADEVQRWITRGWLRCRTVDTSGLKKRIIDPDDFSEFVKQHVRAVVGRRLNAEELWFVQNFVFPPKHARLPPLGESENKPSAETSEEDDDIGLSKKSA